MDFSRNHFALFGLPERFDLDTARLDQAWRALQAEIHPDRFAHAGEAEQRLAMQWATRVNEAYQALKKPFERARYLLALRGIDALAAQHTAMPPAFLIQQMAWREELAEATQARDMHSLQTLEKTLRAESTTLQTALATQLDVARDDPLAAETLRKLRFMDKLREEIDRAYDTCS